MAKSMTLLRYRFVPSSWQSCGLFKRKELLPLFIVFHVPTNCTTQHFIPIYVSVRVVCVCVCVCVALSLSLSLSPSLSFFLSLFHALRDWSSVAGVMYLYDVAIQPSASQVSRLGQSDARMTLLSAEYSYRDLVPLGSRAAELLKAFCGLATHVLVLVLPSPGRNLKIWLHTSLTRMLGNIPHSLYSNTNSLNQNIKLQLLGKPCMK